MKTLLNPTGGRPLKNEDAQLFEQFVTMFEELFEYIPGIGDFIISGCVISGSNISSGYIYYDGKICTFEGATGVSFPLAMERSTVTESTRTYFDTVAKDSINVEYIVAQVGGGFSFSSSTLRWEDYFARKATQTEGRTGTNDVAFMTSLRMLDTLRNGTGFEASAVNRGAIVLSSVTAQTNYIGPGAQQIPLQANFSLYGGTGDYVDNCVAVNDRGDVILSLNVSRVADTNSYVCALPAAFRPPSNLTFSTYIYGGGDAIGSITVQSNGVVFISTGDAYLNISAKCTYKIADY